MYESELQPWFINQSIFTIINKIIWTFSEVPSISIHSLLIHFLCCCQSNYLYIMTDCVGKPAFCTRQDYIVSLIEISGLNVYYTSAWVKIILKYNTCVYCLKRSGKQIGFHLYSTNGLNPYSILFDK